MFFMKKNSFTMVALFTCICVATISPPTYAETDGEKLAGGCAELLSIYNKKEEKSFFSKFSISPSEAMRAGYCRGVIDEYQRNNNHCYNTSWRDQAEAIVRLASRSQHGATNIDYLLKRSCAN